MTRLVRTLALALLVSATPAFAQLDLSPERLAALLKLFPDADANKDGVLSIDEATNYYATLRMKRGTKAPSGQPFAAGLQPTFANVAYGPHERNVLDFWQAKGDAPAPVVVYIHGGGFVSGSKDRAGSDPMVKRCLDAGVSFAAINYRYRMDTPIQDVLRDCARAIQYIRSRASEWHVDKARIASYGGSAGAGASLWLAFHDDLADPNSTDPVLRESSRLCCAGAISTQFSYDILRWKELFGEDVAKRFADPLTKPEGFYGLKSEEELNGPVGTKVRADCDMIGLISRDDPPVFLTTSGASGEVKDRNQFLHDPRHAEAVLKACRAAGVPAVANLPALKIAPGKDDPRDLQAFLFKHLKVAGS